MTTRTISFEPTSGSAIDPLVQEVTWCAWEPDGADPTRVSEALVQHVNIGFDCVVEAAWRPGQSVVISETAWESGDGGAQGNLRVRLGVGMLGPRHTTAEDVEGLIPRITASVSGAGLFAASRIDPVLLVPACAPSSAEVDLGSHAAHLVQGLWLVGDEDDLVEVVRRFAPTVEPWSSVVDQLSRSGQAIRVRATVLATELSPSDRLELEGGLARVRAIRERSERRLDIQFDADRAEATLLDLRASFASPVLAGELAVCSARRLPDTMLRSLAMAFTSEVDVLRRQGHVVVASNRLVLGGFDILRDPEGWLDAQRGGVPLRGGLRQRNLRDLLSLTECPIGWPIPFGGPLPSISTHVPVERSLPDALRPGVQPTTTVGRTPSGASVALPLELRTRHLLATGTPGAGKTTLLFSLALDDLRAGRSFVFVDPHGTAADGLIAFARHLGTDPVVFDSSDGGTARLLTLPRRGTTHRSRAAVDSAIRRIADAISSSLPNPEWTGPRWFAAFEALLELVVVHRGELLDGAVWLNDPSLLRRRLEHPDLSPLARSTLSNLLVSTGEGGDVRGWVTSKLHPVVGGAVRRVIAPVGCGVDLGAAITAGRPVIVSLAGLATSEANLVGHLVLASAIDAAFARPVGERALLTCFVDEAHRFPARGLSRAIAEGRKFGIALAVATQSLGQLPDDLADLAIGAGTLAVFRSTPDTAAKLSPVVGVPVRDLLAQPDLHAVVAVQGHPPTVVILAPYESCPVPRVVRPPRLAAPPSRRPRTGAGGKSASAPRRARKQRLTLVDQFLAEHGASADGSGAHAPGTDP